MSIKNSPKKQKGIEIISPEEQEYIRQLQNKKIALQQATNQKYKSMLQNCYQMEEMGNDINVNLKGQTQKLQKIHDTSDNMKKILKKADETSKQMASFWYSIGKKIKKVFVKERDDDEFMLQSKKKKEQLTHQGSGNIQESNFTKCQNSTNNNLSNEPQNDKDVYLDEITNQIRKLKNLSRGTNQELTKQHQIINSLDKKIDENSGKMNEVNKRIVKKFF